MNSPFFPKLSPTYTCFSYKLCSLSVPVVVVFLPVVLLTKYPYYLMLQYAYPFYFLRVRLQARKKTFWFRKTTTVLVCDGMCLYYYVRPVQTTSLLPSLRVFPKKRANVCALLFSSPQNEHVLGSLSLSIFCTQTYDILYNTITQTEADTHRDRTSR